MIANYELRDYASRRAAIDELESIIDELTITCDDNAAGTQATRAASVIMRSLILTYLMIIAT